MVARYKVHKQRADKWDDGYFRPWSSDPDAVERQKARLDVKQGLKDNEDSNDLLLRMEEQFYADTALDEECWRRQQADPENYVCRCFEDKNDKD